MSNQSCNSSMVVEVAAGPAELYSCLGATALAMWVSVGAVLGASLLYTLHHRPRRDHPFRRHILSLQLTPWLLGLVTGPALLAPATQPLVSMLQDVVSVAAMVVFVHFTLHYTGPLTSLQASCPLGTPPLCCLMCCPKPAVSPNLEKLILLPFTLTPLALALNTLANLYLAYSGHIPDQEQFFSLDNIHNCLKIPFFVTMMYSFKIFFSITAPPLAGSNPKLRGALLFQMFAFCKLFEMIFSFKAVRNSFPCIPGLSPVQLGTLVTALSQLLYLTIIVAVMPRMYAKPWIDSMLPPNKSAAVTPKAEPHSDALLESDKMLENGSS